MSLKDIYNKNKASKVGDDCKCPSCGTQFIKTNYQQAFCRSKAGTICKDRYWNTVTPNKRNNTTRISPASKRYTDKRDSYIDHWDIEDSFHPFDSYSLGQE